MKYQLTIIIPVFNEEGNLNRLSLELTNYLENTKVETTVLFVDDCSDDNSLQIIKEICEENIDFDYISFKENKGLSAALKAGFDYSESHLIGYLDADLQTSPRDFNLLLEYIDSYELVTGIRANREDSIIKNFSSKFANHIRRFFTKDGMSDTGCPLKLIRTENAQKIPMFKGLHRFLPAMILLQNGRVKEIPIQHYPRTSGKSKFGLINRIFGTFIDCFIFLWIKRRYINYEIEMSSKSSD